MNVITGRWKRSASRIMRSALRHPFRVGQSEAALGLFLQVASLLVTQNHDRFAVDTGHAALDGAVVAVAPVTAQLEVVVADEI